MEVSCLIQAPLVLSGPFCVLWTASCADLRVRTETKRYIDYHKIFPHFTAEAKRSQKRVKYDISSLHLTFKNVSAYVKDFLESILSYAK